MIEDLTPTVRQMTVEEAIEFCKEMGWEYDRVPTREEFAALAERCNERH